MAMHELPHGSPLTQCELARRDRQLRRSDRPHTGGKSPAFRREGAKSRETRTLCWREMDSNHRSPLAIAEVRTPERRSPRQKYLHSLCLGARYSTRACRAEPEVRIHLLPRASQQRTVCSFRPPMGDSGGSACPSRRCRDIDRATDATNPVSQLSCAGIIVVPTTGREKNPGRGRCPF